MLEKMSDLCEVENDGFEIFMEVLYGIVVTIGILANGLVCCVFLSDIRIKNVSMFILCWLARGRARTRTVPGRLVRSYGALGQAHFDLFFSVISDIW